ncbi:MAG: hypothetical protein S4CHLAM45_02560 [Chlamydiales bacterium]|nr:hypothetical protein [Chlamydiales bacterium]MCH9619115.1 hypothetical protein [Chlamydiales bacterium]MCH9622377.1 hypothetical protein [Chlamydiales bacterium]
MDLSHLSLEARVILGKAELLAPDYHSLRVGDIIQLDQKTADPLPLVIGGKTYFTTTAGLDGTHKAVKLETHHE